MMYSYHIQTVQNVTDYFQRDPDAGSAERLHRLRI